MKAFVATLPLEHKTALILETTHLAKRLDQCVFLAAYQAGQDVLRIANPTVINSLTPYAGPTQRRSRMSGVNALSDNTYEKTDHICAIEGNFERGSCSYCTQNKHTQPETHPDKTCCREDNEASEIDHNGRKVWHNGNIVRQLCVFGSGNEAQPYVDALIDGKVNRIKFESLISKARHASDFISSSTGKILVCMCNKWPAAGVMTTTDWYKAARDCKAKKAVTDALVFQGRELRGKPQESINSITSEETDSYLMAIINDEGPRNMGPRDCSDQTQ